MIGLNIEHLLFLHKGTNYPYLNLELLDQQEKKVEAAAAMLRWS